MSEHFKCIDSANMEIDRLTTYLAAVTEERDGLKNQLCLTCREPVTRWSCDECAPKLSAGYRNMALFADNLALQSRNALLEEVADAWSMVAAAAGVSVEDFECECDPPSDSDRVIINLRTKLAKLEG